MKARNLVSPFSQKQVLFAAVLGVTLSLLLLLFLSFHSGTVTDNKIDMGTSSKLSTFKSTMEKVYGPYVSSGWKPKNFEENKSRYLWTDAFGVVNFLTLYSETKDQKYLEQAKILVQTVHDTLGKNREGSGRLGKSTDGRPLLGGLRIGKPKPEGSGMSEDGQYYHYLTKWMFALNAMYKVTGDQQYNSFGVDLAKSVHPHFVQKTGSGLRMFWKMSIDLQRPLVGSEGGLDPYDGFAMYRLLQESSKDPEVLKKEIEDMKVLVEARYKRYQTDDCLDAGEALWLAHFFPKEPWSNQLLDKASQAVNRLWSRKEFDGSPNYRLAFREFGTTIGVQMHPELLMQKSDWKNKVEQLHKFWENHLYSRDHDITPVMFCSSLIPGWLQKEYTGG